MTEDPAAPEEERPPNRPLLDLLEATPLGDVLIFLAFCAVGTLVIRAFSVHPIISTVVVLVAIAVFLWRVDRATGRPLGATDWILLTLFAVGAVVTIGVVGLFFFDAVCGC